MRLLIVLIIPFIITGCQERDRRNSNNRSDSIHEGAVILTPEEADRLAELPLKCMMIEFPNKLNQTLSSVDEIGTPRELHPAFYGCFDWHSSVHDHWMLIKLLKEYPQLAKADQIKTSLLINITPMNIAGEINYFIRESESGFERTYGWAWLLKLAEEIHTWDDPIAKDLENNLQPLTDIIVNKYIEFLPRLVYPIRVGEHTNTAFGLSLAYDYACTMNDTTFKSILEKRAREFYVTDTGCPYSWEPSGYDFLSPCLTEVDLMRRVLAGDEFKRWLISFFPELYSEEFYINPAIVSDRSDGKLLHLDGLNFSRAWCLYGLANTFDELSHLRFVADSHMRYSLAGITDGGYEGEHWLASFAVYALSESGQHTRSTK